MNGFQNSQKEINWIQYSWPEWRMKKIYISQHYMSKGVTKKNEVKLVRNMQLVHP